jgi:glycosyltransferase involved in cell wall biosynthesis
MKNRIYFYSSVKSIELFETQKFYKIDIDILKDLNYNVHATNKISDFFFFWRYDIAFIYFYRYGFFVSFIAKLLGKNVYFTGGIDDLDESYATPKNYLIQKYFFKLCHLFSNKCILVSTSDYKNVKKIYNGDLPNKISISYHTIATDNFLCEDIRNKGNDFTTIVWMGDKGNVIRKGVDDSLRLFQLLIHNYSQYKYSKFIIIGKKGDGTQYLVQLCKDLNILDKVEFTDEIDELTKIKLLKYSRFYMQLSKYEGFGISAAEALAAQNIVINSGRGGLFDSVSHYGVQVDINDDLTKQIEGINQKIENVNSDFLKSGEEYVVKNFSYNLRKIDFKKIMQE